MTQFHKTCIYRSSSRSHASRIYVLPPESKEIVKGATALCELTGKTDSETGVRLGTFANLVEIVNRRCL